MRLNEHPNSSSDYKRARDLRNNASLIEKKLWVVLRTEANKKGLKFRRQHAIHPYFAGFACLEAQLLIELDGASHENRQVFDAKRDHYLREMGFQIIRFRNDEVTKSVEGVVAAILEKAEMILNKR